EIERRQVGDRNVGASRYASLGRRAWRGQYPPDIREDTAAGRTTRDALVRTADGEKPNTNEMTGAELGSSYIGARIIDDEPGGRGGRGRGLGIRGLSGGGGGTGRTGASLSRVRADDLAWRAPAARLARRPAAAARSDRRRVHTVAARPDVG